MPNSFTSKGPSIKDVSPNFKFLRYPPSPCLPKSTSERLLFGHFLYPLPPPLGRRLLWMVPKKKLSWYLHTSQEIPILDQENHEERKMLHQIMKKCIFNKFKSFVEK